MQYRIETDIFLCREIKTIWTCKHRVCVCLGIFETNVFVYVCKLYRQECQLAEAGNKSKNVNFNPFYPIKGNVITYASVLMFNPIFFKMVIIWTGSFNMFTLPALIKFKKKWNGED